MKHVAHVAAPPSKPLMIYDGDCNFCRRWIARWQQATGEQVDYLPFQDPTVTTRFPEIPLPQYEDAIQLVEPDGRVYRAAEAVFRSLASAPRYRWLLASYERASLFAFATEYGYGVVARNRPLFSTLTRWLWGDHLEAPTHVLTRWLFLRLLGIIYLVAFVSLWTQVDGLIGSDGILPVRETMESVSAWARHENLGWQRYFELPTLCWFSSSDSFLHFLCGGGTALSLCAIVGVAPTLAFALLWLFYLSLSIVGRDFLSFQWDALLLETGFLAIFFAPLQWLPRISREPPPSGAVLCLLRWLLFRLMFSSGIVKLASGDTAWRNLSALEFHYETQPLPTVIGWYAHQLPVWFQQLSCGLMFVIELAVPFLIFAPRRPRLVGCAALVGLQILIAMTGNYCFFNWLTLALCVLLLDDAFLCRLGGAPVRRCTRAVQRDRRSQAAPTFASRRWPPWIIAPLTTIILLVTIVELPRTFREPVRWPAPFMMLTSLVQPFRSINNYGLFAVMTTSRPEIIVQGSNDGETWRTYEFKYKPGDPDRPPRFVAPHQPRLDWQMWFAALGSYQNNDWFVRFCAGLLRGSPPILGLLQTNPFPDAPPARIRAVVYDYRFTDWETRRKTGAWWRRTLKGMYSPEWTLRNP